MDITRDNHEGGAELVGAFDCLPFMPAAGTYYGNTLYLNRIGMANSDRLGQFEIPNSGVNLFSLRVQSALPAGDYRIRALLEYCAVPLDVV
jgi:hypothetical protein